MTTSAPITERRYGTPLILVTTLFFLWALGVNLNDVLIPHLKKVFDLNDFQSALIQVAFFGGYCLSALPAGRLLERIGYKNGIVVGLLTCATGALLFIPAASIQVYGLFLFASFVMASGQGVLEVAANPNRHKPAGNSSNGCPVTDRGPRNTVNALGGGTLDVTPTAQCLPSGLAGRKNHPCRGGCTPKP